MQPDLLSRRLIRLLLFCVIVLPLAGCGDKEPEQRKHFIAILENNIVAKPGLSVTTLNTEDQKRIGSYAKHYQVILDFHAAMSRDVAPQLSDIARLINIKSLDQAMENHETIVKASKSAVNVKQKVIDQLAKTDAARTPLKQPDDLAGVYDNAYEKAVRRPAHAFLAAFDKVEGLLNTAASLVDFLRTHKDGLVINGQTVQVKDAVLQLDLDARLKAVEESTEALREAYNDLSAVTK